MTQRAYAEPRPKRAALPAETGSKVRSLNPQSRKDQGFPVLRMILQLSLERRAVIGDVKRNACEVLAFLTLAAPVDAGEARPLWAPPHSWEEWAELLGTTPNNAQEAFSELEGAGVLISCTGAEARQERIPRPRGTHPGTKHFRLYVENWSAVAVSKPANLVPMPAKPKVTAAAGEPLRMLGGDRTEALPIGAQVENYALDFSDPDQLGLELIQRPIEVRDNVLHFSFVAKKTASEEHILLQPDLPKKSHALLCEELRAGMLEREHPITAILARAAMEASAWADPEHWWKFVDDSIERCKASRKRFSTAWLKSTIARDVRDVAGQAKRAPRTKPGHCVNCGAPPDRRSTSGVKCRHCGGLFDVLEPGRAS